MKLVVLIEDTAKFASADFIEQDMRRWWRHACKKHIVGGETFFEISNPKMWGKESIKRLASFGVKARIARRPTWSPLTRRSAGTGG